MRIPGWLYLRNSGAFHYLDDAGRSLCRRWLYFGRKPVKPFVQKGQACETCMERKAEDRE